MSMAKLRSAHVLTALLLGSLLAGCGGKNPDDVVASVDGVPITVAYFEAKWAKLASNDADFKPTPANLDSMRGAVLDVLINKELMVNKALEEKMVEDTVYREAYDNQLDYRLIEALKNREVVDKMPTFTEDDLLAHYKYLGLTVKARHIDMDLLEDAQKVVADLRAGTISFADAVAKYSTNQDRDRGGDLGTVSFGSNIKPVEDALFNMGEGEITDPIKTPYGYSIFIVDSVKNTQPQEYAAVRESIKRRLETRALREKGAEHAERALKKHGFKFHWDTAEKVLAKMPDDMTPSQAAQSRANTEEKPVLKFSPEELKMTLYELEGKDYTLQEFSDEYDRLHPFARPQKANRLQGIYNYVQKEVVGKVMPEEARTQGLDKDPEVIVAMKEFEEQACIGAVRRVFVERNLHITEADERAFYEKNPLYYTIKPQVRCKQIINSEEAKIQDAWKRLQAGDSFDDVGRDVSIVFDRQWVTDWFTPDSIANPENEAIRLIARLQEPGEMTEPFYYQGYWGIMQLFETRPAHLMEFEEAKSRVEKDVHESMANAMLDSLLGEWRKDADVEIDQKVLGKTEMGEAPNPDHGRF
ncbi:MAG: peptidyl-prolyl cis-trans isomerase [Candidatus Latescibacteria bacterium]|nr:peptidyl-prolyl cis-trans isomerase [Candidatus Latescibacterota bacterium]